MYRFVMVTRAKTWSQQWENMVALFAIQLELSDLEIGDRFRSGNNEGLTGAYWGVDTYNSWKCNEKMQEISKIKKYHGV